MKLLVPFAAIGLLLGTASVHPQPYDRGPAPPFGYGTPEYALQPDERPPARRMICVIDPSFPDHQQTCSTHSGYPGSPCRCAGSLFEGERTLLN